MFECMSSSQTACFDHVHSYHLGLPVLLLQHKAATPAYDAYNEREKLDFAHNPIEDLSVPTEQQ